MRPADGLPHPTHRFPLLRRVGVVFGSLLLLLVVAGAVAVVALRHRMQTSLAPLDGELHLQGLSAAVAVRRDGHGVPHIEAANLGDLLAAQGWVTASDRLWQMDMARRLPAGEAAEILGPGLVRHDTRERVLGMRDVAARLVRTMPADQLAQLEAYARGVNAYIALAEQRGTLPAEFELLMYRPAPWRPVDSVLIALSMSEMLDERWQAKLKREQVEARLAAHGQAALAADLYPTGSWRDRPPVPDAPGIGDPQVVPQIPLDPSQTRVNMPPSRLQIGASSSQGGWQLLQARLQMKQESSQQAGDLQQARLQIPLLPAGELLASFAGSGSEHCAGCRPGSNEWAVSGAHTASGRPMLSNDMHLVHQIPDLWYETELHAGSFHAAGVTVAGLPWIAAGHNDHIAWGFTALGGDTQDIYVELVNGRGEYRARSADGGESWHLLQHEREVIRVRGGRDVELDVERTAHGPVITPLLGALGKGDERRVLALDWAIYDDRAKGLPLFALDSASDWASFRAALGTWWAPTLNVVYADDAGHIGYQAVGLIPVRGGGLQSLPITPGVTRAAVPVPSTGEQAGADGQAAGQGAVEGSAPSEPASPLPPVAPGAPAAPVAASPVGEWTGFIPFDAMPSVLDPEGGIVATANARVTPKDSPYPITLDWADPYRNERIWRWLGGQQKLTRADMLKLQTDVFSESDQEIAQRFAYAIDHAAHPTPRARAAADILRSWDGVLGAGSPGAAIVTVTEQMFWPAVLGAKIGDGWQLYDWSESGYAREEMITHQPAAWLPAKYASWNDFLAGLVDNAVEHAPSDLRSWRYGDVHTIQIEHPLWKLLPGLRSGVGPLPQTGDHATVKQVSGDLGPSQRLTVDLSDLDGSTENIVMGQSEDPVSPFYRDQWASWYGGTTFALPFSAGAVQAAATHTLRLVP